MNYLTGQVNVQKSLVILVEKWIKTGSMQERGPGIPGVDGEEEGGDTPLVGHLSSPPQFIPAF